MGCFERTHLAQLKPTRAAILAVRTPRTIAESEPTMRCLVSFRSARAARSAAQQRGQTTFFAVRVVCAVSHDSATRAHFSHVDANKQTSCYTLITQSLRAHSSLAHKQALALAQLTTRHTVQTQLTRNFHQRAALRQSLLVCLLSIGSASQFHTTCPDRCDASNSESTYNSKRQYNYIQLHRTNTSSRFTLIHASKPTTDLHLLLLPHSHTQSFAHVVCASTAANKSKRAKANVFNEPVIVQR